MSVSSIATLDNAFHRSLRVASAVSYGSLVMPYDASVEWSPVRARKVPPLKQWIIERENFDTAVVEGYTEMEDGAIRQLVAGTGVGKSTTMPYAIAVGSGVSGLVLVPNNALPVMCLPYLRRKYAEMGGLAKVEILRTAHASTPVVAPCVYYCSAVDFLARLAKRPTFLTDIGIDFIYLDESHETRPDYTVFKYIKEVGLLGSVKIFFGTATAAADVDMEAGGVGRNVQGRPSNLFNTSTPAVMTAMSPLHYSNIQNKTLVFVATDQEAQALANYYDIHDIPVLAHLMELGDKRLGDIPTFLTRHSLCVLVVHSMFQTGFTLDVDTVIDSGYVLELVAMFDEGKMELKKRPVTQAERTQRMGRVGRFKPGNGYYSDVQVSPPLAENSPERALYTFLWCKVFGITINEPDIAMFADLTGDISPMAAAMLLHSRVHPYLMLPYVANDGFYERWGKTMRYTLYSAVLLESEESNVDKVENWKDLSTGPVDYADAPIAFKTAVQFPREWYVIPSSAWLVYARYTDVRAFQGLSSRSVISAVSSSPRSPRRSRVVSFAPPARSVVTESSESTVTAPPVYASRDALPRSLPSSSSRSSLGEPRYEVDVPSIRRVQDAYSVQTVAPDLGHVQRSRESLPPSRTGPLERVESWRGSVSPRGVPDRRRSVSDTSSERDEIPLRQVDPQRYAEYKLYPIDPEIFKEYVRNEGISRSDHKRVNALLSGRTDFSALKDDTALEHGTQLVYFLAVLRVHNSALSRKLQITSNVRPGMMARMVGSLDSELITVKSQILSTVRLLRACALQSFYVGIDTRALHVSETSSVLTPVYTEFESSAKIMLAFGDERVLKLVNALCQAASPMIVSDTYGREFCKGNAWKFGNTLFAVAHSIESNNHDSWPEEATGVKVSDFDNDVVVFNSSVTSGKMYTREARDSESVYVIYYDYNDDRVAVIGVFDLCGSGDPLTMEFMLTHGYSGALVVSVDDGAVLGIYRGEYAQGTAWVIPIHYVEERVSS